MAGANGLEPSTCWSRTIRFQEAKSARLVVMAKILEIGNYPPPMCGWAIQTYLLEKELIRRDHTCRVLKINEGRQIKSSEYADVQDGFDYFYKILRYAGQGFRFHSHVNGETWKGYLLALLAALVARLFGQPAVLTFHGGLSQSYFPRPDSWKMRTAFRLLFHLSGRLTCDSLEIKKAIEGYGVKPEKIAAIPCFSAELLDFLKVPLAPTRWKSSCVLTILFISVMFHFDRNIVCRFCARR